MMSKITAAILFACGSALGEDLLGANYVTVAGNIGCTASGLQEVTDENQCRMAGVELGYLESTEDNDFKINQGRSRTRRPFGCYYDTPRGKVQFNLDGNAENAAGEETGNDKRWAICHAPGTTTTTEMVTTTSTVPPTTTTTSTTTTEEPTTTTTSTTTTEEPTTTTTVPATTTTAEPVTTTTEMTYEYELKNEGCQGVGAVEDIEECNEAATMLELADTTAKQNAKSKKFERPLGCYFDLLRNALQFNPNGVEQTDVNRPTICRIVEEGRK